MPLRLIACLILALGVLAACAMSWPLPGVRPAADGWQPWPGDALAEGRALLRAGQPALAIARFRKALVDEAAGPLALNGLAVAYAELGRADLSLRFFQEALARAPDDLATLNNIGFAALRRGELDLARRYFARAKRIDPAEPVVAGNLARLAMLEGEVALAALIERPAVAPTVAPAEPQRLRLAPDPPALARQAPPRPRLKPRPEPVAARAITGGPGAWQSAALAAARMVM